MKRLRTGLLLLLVVVLAFAASPALAKKAECPAPGTEVPFDKVMSKDFADDYMKCDVVIHGEFLFGNASQVSTFFKKGQITFQAVGPNRVSMLGPNGVIKGNVIAIPKEKSDIVFELKPGDKIKLRGAPDYYFNFITKTNMRELIFMAISVERDSTVPAKAAEQPAKADPAAARRRNRETPGVGFGVWVS